MRVNTLFPAIFGLVVAGCVGSGDRTAGADDDETMISGTVAYRERLALPSDAVVEVRLSDVSRQDAAAPVIAETTVLSEGRQVPIPFELRFDPDEIDPDRTYAVRATIASAGRTMFTTTTAYPVITRGNPTQVDIVLERAVGDSASGSNPLSGSKWRLDDLGGAGVVAGVDATLEFPAVDKAAGNGSCNRFFGTVRIAGESIDFSALGSTLMACVDEAAGNQERIYFRALEDAARFTLDDSTLLIYYEGSEEPLRFVREAS